MKKTLTYSLAFVWALAFLSTCSSPEDMIAPPASEDTIITDEERMLVFEACKKKSAELNNLESLEDRVSFLAWLATQPAFFSSGFAGEDLYAVFQDGRVLLFVNTPLGDNIGGRVSVDKRPSSGSKSNNSSGRTEDVPKSKKVSLFKGLGTRFNNNPEIIKGIFAEADAGYQVELKDASIANLKTVSGDAVFYISTHGGAGQLHTRNGPLSIMALWTTDLITAGTEVTYKRDLDEERMCYIFAPHNTAASEPHYGITSSFVREYMSFGENCLIYLDACNGFNETVPGNVTFRERMIAKATNGKATFVGWTGVTYDGTTTLTSQFIFDRLLGANSGGNISQEDPDQRPFEFASVYDDMRSEGLGVAQNSAQLTYKTTVEQGVLLRPTIETMEIDEFTSKLIIKGRFPVAQGQVTVNGVSAVVDSWSPYGIVCTINETGDGSVGEVMVKSSEGIKSNAVPLTEYIIKLSYSSNDNGVVFAGVADLRLRADVHMRRAKIGETPTKPTYPDYSPTSGFIFNVKGSSATYSVTGRKYDACNVGPCRYQYTVPPTPKGGTVNYTIPTLANIPLFAMYNWGPEMKTVKISFITISVPGIPCVYEVRTKCPNMAETVVPVEMPYDALFGFPTHELDGAAVLEIAENFNIRPGSWTKTIDRPWSNCSATGTFKQTLSWDVVVPKHAPKTDTPARIGDVGN